MEAARVVRTVERMPPPDDIPDQPSNPPPANNDIIPARPSQEVLPVLAQALSATLSTNVNGHMGVPREELDFINRTYALVRGSTNAGKIVRLSDPSSPSFIPPDRFHVLFGADRADVAVGPRMFKSVPKSAVWMQWPGQRQIDEIIFEPPGSPFKVGAHDHNMWAGFGVQQRAGEEHEPLLAHIRDNICSGNDAWYGYALDWLADLVQQRSRA